MKITHYDDHRPKRAAAYPPATEQLDAIWKALGALQAAGASIGADASAMLARVNAVKAQFPKAPGVE